MKKFRFLTILLNPSIDYFLHCNNFLVDGKNLLNSTSLFPGGKGLNVAVSLSKLEQQVSIIGFLGQPDFHFFENEMNRQKINADFIILNQPTRTNFKIINDATRQCTEFNKKGFRISKNNVDTFVKLLENKLRKSDFVSISGSLPPGVPQNFYFKLIEKIKKHNVICGLDASGKALANGINSKPQILRINKNELEELIGRNLRTLNQIVNATILLQKMGISLIVVSMGDQGAIANNGLEIWQAKPPKINAINPIGAGDAMMAGCLYEYASKSPLPLLLRNATALAATSVLFENSFDINLDKMDEIAKKINLIKIS